MEVMAAPLSLDSFPPLVPSADAASAPPPTPAVPSWTAAQKTSPSPGTQEAISSRLFARFNSSKGVSVAVVDANAIIHGDKLAGVADKFVSVREVLEEVRDPASRRRLAFLPFPVETVEPAPEFVKKVVKFARETGDLHTLSDVDIKIIALAYMLEAQIHGTNHLREQPPPLHVVNVKNLRESDMPGWGSNVPNLAEWEALDQATEGCGDSGSRILPLTDLNDQVIPGNGAGVISQELDDEHQSYSRPRRAPALKKEIIIEGKKMVAQGIDASQGEDHENADDWSPAVSRSTRRRYLRRKARREAMASEVNAESCGEDGMDPTDNPDVECDSFQEENCDAFFEHDNPVQGTFGEPDVSAVQELIILDNDSLEHIYEESGQEAPRHCMGSDHPIDVERGMNRHDSLAVECDVNSCAEGLDDLDIKSEADESVDAAYTEDGSSEQSWMLRSLSESSVACITSDYAMQNVLLQIGLRLLAPGGMQIHKLHRWVLKCHACHKVTQEIGRIFCPKCGNGGTLRKVSVTVGENGVVLAARRQRFVLRGTKFSLPMPQGGREAVTKNPVLREDQLPHKLLYPKQKKTSKQEDDLLCPDSVFSLSGEKRVPLKPPVRKAIAMFSGKRNPNDNHYSRRLKH